MRKEGMCFKWKFAQGVRKCNSNMDEYCNVLKAIDDELIFYAVVKAFW
jgi:hypothetical protein